MYIVRDKNCEDCGCSCVLTVYCRLIDGYVAHVKKTQEDFILFVSNEMSKRIDFARMVIEVEPKDAALAETVLMYTTDKHNAIIHHLLKVWRECKGVGLPLFKLKKEQYLQLEQYVYQLKKNNKKEYAKVEAQALRMIQKVRHSAANYAVSGASRDRSEQSQGSIGESIETYQNTRCW